MNQKLQTQIDELKAIILESREWGHNKVADMFAEELETLLANEQLIGNKPRERIDLSGGDFD
jgi:hypothetical protein